MALSRANMFIVCPSDWATKDSLEGWGISWIWSPECGTFAWHTDESAENVHISTDI